MIAQVRVIIACIQLTAAAGTTSLVAAEEPKLPPGVTCEVVRELVTLHGRLAAYAWAKLNGYSKKEIAEARKCLRS